MVLTGTVPVSKELLTRGVPVNNLFQYGNQNYFLLSNMPAQLTLDVTCLVFLSVLIRIVLTIDILLAKM